MKNSMKIVTIIISILIVLAVILYFLGVFNSNSKTSVNGANNGGNRYQNNRSRGFQLNQSQIDDVTTFFNNNPDQTTINTYCQQNRANCFYYCRNIDSTNQYCNGIMNFTRNGNFTNGNFTREPFNGS